MVVGPAVSAGRPPISKRKFMVSSRVRGARPDADPPARLHGSSASRDCGAVLGGRRTRKRRRGAPGYGRGPMTKRVLTGIKPTGYPHLGNYVGAIRPALRRATDPEHSFFFIADYHALNQVQDPAAFNEYSYVVAASWLACGLDPSVCSFYRQSDIRETFELTTILS